MVGKSLAFVFSSPPEIHPKSTITKLVFLLRSVI